LGWSVFRDPCWSFYSDPRSREWSNYRDPKLLKVGEYRDPGHAARASPTLRSPANPLESYFRVCYLGSRNVVGWRNVI